MHRCVQIHTQMSKEMQQMKLQNSAEFEGADGYACRTKVHKAAGLKETWL